jgi:hypothetical protein
LLKNHLFRRRQILVIAGFRFLGAICKTVLNRVFFVMKSLSINLKFMFV